jgi:hypothetical protein
MGDLQGVLRPGEEDGLRVARMPTFAVKGAAKMGIHILVGRLVRLLR